jgi:hypothetical protein
VKYPIGQSYPPAPGWGDTAPALTLVKVAITLARSNLCLVFIEIDPRFLGHGVDTFRGQGLNGLGR